MRRREEKKGREMYQEVSPSKLSHHMETHCLWLGRGKETARGVVGTQWERGEF